MFLMFNVMPLTRPAESQLTQRVHITPVDEFALGTAIKSRESTWSVLQLIAAALGGFLVVLGSAVIVATGVTDWTDSTATVWGFTHTPLLAAAEVVLGLLLLASSASAKATRAALIGFGALMAAFGAIVLLEPAMFADTLAPSRQVGMLFAASGAGSVVLGSLVR
jgi:hypothetical protein